MEGYIALNMSVGELVDRHVGRTVGKSVSPETACSQNINRTLWATIALLKILQFIWFKQYLFQNCHNTHKYNKRII